MALYYTLSIVILNKMAVKLDSLSCRRADVISRQSQRSRINSGGGFLMLTVGVLWDDGEEQKNEDIFEDFNNLIIILNLDQFREYGTGGDHWFQIGKG